MTDRKLMRVRLKAAQFSNRTCKMRQLQLLELRASIIIDPYSSGEDENRSFSMSPLHTVKWHFMTFTLLIPPGFVAGPRTTRASAPHSEIRKIKFLGKKHKMFHGGLLLIVVLQKHFS